MYSIRNSITTKKDFRIRSCKLCMAYYFINGRYLPKLDLYNHDLFLSLRADECLNEKKGLYYNVLLCTAAGESIRSIISIILFGFFGQFLKFFLI